VTVSLIMSLRFSTGVAGSPWHSRDFCRPPANPGQTWANVGDQIGHIHETFTAAACLSGRVQLAVGCIGRSDLSAEHRDSNSTRCVRPKQVTPKAGLPSACRSGAGCAFEVRDIGREGPKQETRRREFKSVCRTSAGSGLRLARGGRGSGSAQSRATGISGLISGP